MDFSFRESLIELLRPIDPWGLILKLIFHEKINPDPEGILRLVGFVHLYHSSGIHFYALLEWAEKITQVLSRRFSSHTQLIRLLLKIGFYLFLTLLWSLQKFRFGFLRPFILILLRHVLKGLGLKARLLMPLLTTLILDLMMGEPGGRLHYYLAVGGGVIALDLWRDRYGRSSLWLEHSVLAFGSWIAIAMMEFVHEHRISVLTPVISLLTIPILCTVFYPLLVTSVFISKNLLVTLTQWINEGMTQLIAFFDSWNLTWVWVSDLEMKVAVLMGAAVLLMEWIHRRFSFTKISHFYFFGILFLMLFRFRFGSEIQSSWIAQIDVKQGDSFIVKIQNRIEAVDVGSRHAWKPEDWIIKFIRLGINHVDAILITHLDEDHVGALNLWSQMIPIGCIEMHPIHQNHERGKIILAALDSKIKVVSSNHGCVQTMKVGWFGSGKVGSSKTANGNAFMAGVMLPLPDGSAYFAAGDADHHQEAQFLKYFKTDITKSSNKIWKINHHGSRFSTDYELMKVVKPNLAWVSAGKRNHYHHPHPRVIQDLNLLSIPIQQTAEEGDLVFRIKE